MLGFFEEWFDLQWINVRYQMLSCMETGDSEPHDVVFPQADTSDLPNALTSLRTRSAMSEKIP